MKRQVISWRIPMIRITTPQNCRLSMSSPERSKYDSSARAATPSMMLKPPAMNIITPAKSHQPLGNPSQPRSVVVTRVLLPAIEGDCRRAG
jgi:hypothetical protein